MTILVGMVGSDGIILAADQRASRSFGRQDRFDDLMEIEKLIHLESHKVAYAAVGDDVTAEAANRFSIALEHGTFDLARIKQSLTDVGLSVINDKAGFLQPSENRSLLIVFYGDQVSGPQLWSMDMSHSVRADRVPRIKIAGALGNGARFFGHYFPKAPAPIESLKALAAHIVLTASQWDSLMIHGIDIATFEGHEFHLVGEEEKQALRAKSEALDLAIQHHLFGELP